MSLARPTGKRLLVAVLFFLLGAAGFGLIAANIHGTALVGIDQPVAEWMVAHRTAALTSTMLAITNILSPVGFALAVLIGCGVWAWRKKEYWRPLLLVSAMGVAFVVASLIKHVAERQRPPLATMITPFELDFSFPSGHTIGVAVFLFVLGYLLWSRRRSRRAFAAWTAVGLVGVVLVAFSRLYLGYHWVSDVSASTCLALMILALVIAVDPLERTLTKAASSSGQ